MTSPMLFKDRELIELPPPPLGVPTTTRAVGVALDNREAQELYEEDCRVLCDEGGPYLVVRLSAYDQPILTNGGRVDIEVQPEAWYWDGHSGIICWMTQVSDAS